MYYEDDGTYVRGIEDYLPTSQYRTLEHQTMVVKDIVDNWQVLSQGGKFHAILVTSSIPEALEYYKRFKDASTLKVMALFDPSIDNNGGAKIKEEGLKDLFVQGPGLGGEEVPYDIDGYITTIDTDKIDADYMNSRFEKYLKGLHADGSDAKDDQIHRLAAYALGLDESMLRDMMAQHITEDNINEFGRFDALKATVDRNRAKAYFEKLTGQKLPIPKVNVKVDKLLRDFILDGGFDIEVFE